jgi:peptide deformylase
MERQRVEIFRHPNPALTQRAADVDPRTDRALSRLARDMAAALYAAPGVGLAATQVGVQKRVVVIDVDDGLVVLCNPRLEHVSEELEVDDEGCLSLPGITVPVARSTNVVCEAIDLQGERVRIEADGLLSRVVQHEIDHLDGMLIIDRATPEERKAALRRYLESQQGSAPLQGGFSD